jgi:hypothetical protein
MRLLKLNRMHIIIRYNDVCTVKKLDTITAANAVRVCKDIRVLILDINSEQRGVKN